MKSRTRLALALILATSLLASSLEASTPRRWAVVIGLDTYENAGVSPLKYAVADARALADTLRASAGFAPRDVFELTSDKSGDEAPTRTNIAFRFDYLAREIQPGDELLVFFSGHGLEIGGQTFLLTREADPRSLRTLQQSALHARDLVSWLQATRAAKVLLVVDACRNDPSASRSLGDNPLSETLARDLDVVEVPDASSAPLASVATLFACSAGQRSYEWNDQGHGFFTYFLVEGLRGQAADPQGKVTLGSLVGYVQREVADASQRWALQRQQPWLRYEGPGADLWVLNDKATLASAPVRTPPTPAARPRPEPPRPAVARPQPTAAPTVLHVSRQGGADRYQSIGEAVQAAPPGSRIVIGAGTYDEAVVLTKPVELVTTEGAVIRAPAGSPAVEVRAASGVVLEGLTLECRVPQEPIVGHAFMNRVHLVRVRQVERILED